MNEHMFMTATLVQTFVGLGLLIWVLGLAWFIVWWDNNFGSGSDGS